MRFKRYNICTFWDGPTFEEQEERGLSLTIPEASRLITPETRKRFFFKRNAERYLEEVRKTLDERHSALLIER